MTEIQQSPDQPLDIDDSRPLRRPGWGLIQDVSPRRPTSHTVAVKQPESRPRPAPHATSRPQPIIVQPQTNPRQHRLRLWLQRHVLAVATPLVIFASIRLSTQPLIGEILIIAYGVVAIALRIPSRTSFALAAMALAGVGIEVLLLPEAGRANNTSLFVFLLLGIGLVSSMLETRHLAMRGKVSRRR